MNTSSSHVRGFASLAVIIIVVLIIAAAGAEYYGAFSVPATLNQAPSGVSSTTPATDTPAPVTRPTTSAPPPSPSSNLKTYTNTQYGFSIQYPSELPVAADVSSGFFKKVPLLALKNFPSDPAYGETVFIADVSADPTVVASCLSIPSVSENATTVAVHGVQFQLVDIIDPATGLADFRHRYRTVRNNACYGMDVMVTAANPGHLEGQEKLDNQKKVDAAFARLDPIAASFRFTN